MKKLFSMLAIAVISFGVVRAQEPTNATKNHPKSTTKTAEVAKKETTPEKQAKVKTVTSAEASKKETVSDKHKESKAK